MCSSCGPAPITHSSLHHRIFSHFIKVGNAPSIDDLAAGLDQPRGAVVEGLKALQEYHGVVLHPGSSEIWVIHPFSTAPTPFWVQGAKRAWWGNCAWCSLGIVALLKEDATITTTLGGETHQVSLRIEGGRLRDEGYLVHFPVPMKQAWDNVIYTCSTMLLFDSEVAIDRWCRSHRVPRGDAQPVAKVWEFAKTWYGRHLDEDWAKWSAAEARALFARFGLRGSIWDIPEVASRF